MNQKNFNRWIVLNGILIIALMPLVLVSFQNCAPKAFSTSSDDDPNPLGNPTSSGPTTTTTTTTTTTNPNPTHDLVLKDLLIRTNRNEPKNFNAESTGSRTGFTLSLDFASNLSDKTFAEGKVSILSQGDWSMRFEPAENFRGEIKMWLFARHSDGTVVQAQLTLQVGNAVNLLAPALAIRATGCITCHAEVHSNIITDFGFGGDGGSRNYYFGQFAGKALDPNYWGWDYDMIYGDEHYMGSGPTRVDYGSWGYLKLAKKSDGSGQKVYVPPAPLTSGPAAATGASTLKGYIQHKLSNSYYTDSKSGSVIEKSKAFFIGAPTAARLQQVFGWTSADETKKSKFFPDSGAPALSGLNIGASGPTGTGFFTNTGTLVCEGDLMLKGTLLLNNLNVRSRTGCRLYVTGPVFIYGPITYATDGGDYSKRNLQVVSSKAILMGLGSLWKDGTHCEQGSPDSGYWEYWVNREAERDRSGMNTAQYEEYKAAISDSAKFRLQYHWGSESFFYRHDSRAGETVTAEFYNELVNNVAPSLSGGRAYDAACGPQKRNVAYERLLLNAPLVESRYAGGFKGSIIAEMGLMGIGLAENQSRFKFEFDPVFQQADVLPFLKEQDFLHIE